MLPALMLYLGFNAGGYFAGTTAWAAAALAIVLAVRIAVGGWPRGGPSVPLTIAAAVLALLAGWTLLSGSWSGNYGRSLIEFDRLELYLLVLLVFGSIQAPRSAFRFLPIAFAVAAVILCAAGLVTRIRPDLWPFAQPIDANRLAFPVSYSNGLGILCSLGLIACLHLASWDREHRVTRALAAAALPLLGATLVLTFSRGAILAGTIGVLAYAVLARPRGLVTALLGSAPFVFFAGLAAYDADRLSSSHPLAPAALDQGHDVALAVAVAMLASAACVGLLISLERRAFRDGLSQTSRRLAVAVCAIVAIAAGTVAATQASEVIRSLRHEFSGKSSPDNGSLTRARLTDTADIANVGGQTRVQYWRVSLDAFADEPIEGTGVGTFAQRWARDRPSTESVTEGHSVFLETLGELGLVGAVLTVLLLAMLVLPLAARRASSERPLWAAAMALALAWLLHAGIDWDWELPVLTVWLFAFAGCALAASPKTVWGRGRWPVPARVIGVSVCLLLAVTPATIAVSQSRLDSAVAALLRGDCRSAEHEAAEATRLLPPRAEPYEVLAYCYSRQDRDRPAAAMMQRAIDRDPNDWELLYGLALVRGAAGKDPRGAARKALRLNPRELMIRNGVERFAGDDPRRWRREARLAPLPLP